MICPRKSTRLLQLDALDTPRDGTTQVAFFLQSIYSLHGQNQKYNLYPAMHCIFHQDSF